MGVLVDNATEQLLTFDTRGYCLHSCVYIPFGDMSKPGDFLNPTPYGDLKLKLTGEAGVGAIKVMTQQLRK
jgi:hypothetical protein